jgi:hypothetical protein
MDSSLVDRSRFVLLLILAAVLVSNVSYADFGPAVLVTAGALGTDLSWPIELTVYHDKLYFTAQDPSGLRSLWQTDGRSTARIAMPPEMATGSAPGPGELTVYQNQLVFQAVDKQAGYQFWAYDGTQVRRATEYPTTFFQGTSLPPAVFKNQLYFVPWNEEVGQVLWAFDGQSASFPAGIPPEASVTPTRILATTPDRMYLSAWLPSSSSSHETLCQYDGRQLTALPGIVDPRNSKLIRPGNISDFTEFQGQFYFAAQNEINYDYDLWRFNGEKFELLSGIDDIRSNLVVRDNRLFVMAGEPQRIYRLPDGTITYTDPLRRSELWTYDGQHAEQVTHAGIGPFDGPDCCSEIFNSGDGLLITLNTNLGTELWRYDGQELALAANVNQIPRQNTVLPYADESSYPAGFTLYRGDVYFLADDGIHDDRGLWKLPRAVPEPSADALAILAVLLTGRLVRRRGLPKE